MDVIVSETIKAVFHGNICWVVYGGKPDDPLSPVSQRIIPTNTYAAIDATYSDGSVESYVAPLIATRDGLMTWANYFSNFVGAIHQSERPTDQQVLKFIEDMANIDQQVRELIKNSKNPKDPNDPPPDDGNPSGPKTIKFSPKHRPNNPDGDK